MLNETKDKLLILESFRVDRDLPKFVKEEAKAKKGGSISKSGFVSSEMSFGEMSFGDDFTPRMGGRGRPTNWLSRLFQKREKKPELSIRDFFVSVKNSAEEIKVVEARAAGYEAALREAKQNGQRALCEKLEAGILAFRAESQMLAIGIRTYVPERTLITFYMKSPKGLRLDYIRNFTRRIPMELSSLKMKADELGVFDNYAVLHYDLKAKSYAETEKEKLERIAKERDPILFGLLQGRDDLYVLGDWVDEYCNLTLDQMADVMGASVTKDIAEVGPDQNPTS